MEPCYAGDNGILVSYTDAHCSGQKYAANGEVISLGGTLYWPQGQKMSATQTYLLLNGECRTGGAKMLAPLTPVPQDVLGLLPTPPYSLKPAY